MNTPKVRPHIPAAKKKTGGEEKKPLGSNKKVTFAGDTQNMTADEIAARMDSE